MYTRFTAYVKFGCICLFLFIWWYCLFRFKLYLHPYIYVCTKLVASHVQKLIFILLSFTLLCIWRSLCFFTLQAHCEFHLLLFSRNVWSRNLTLFHHLLELHIIPACLFCCQRLTSLQTRTLVLWNPWFGFVLISSFAFWPCVCLCFDPEFPQAPVWSMKTVIKMYCFVQSKDTILSAIPLSMFAYCLSETTRRICIKSVSHFLNRLMVFLCFLEFVFACVCFSFCLISYFVFVPIRYTFTTALEKFEGHTSPSLVTNVNLAEFGGSYVPLRATFVRKLRNGVWDQVLHKTLFTPWFLGAPKKSRWVFTWYPSQVKPAISSLT